MIRPKSNLARASGYLLAVFLASAACSLIPSVAFPTQTPTRRPPVLIPTATPRDFSSGDQVAASRWCHAFLDIIDASNALAEESAGLAAPLTPEDASALQALAQRFADDHEELRLQATELPRQPPQIADANELLIESMAKWRTAYSSLALHYASGDPSHFSAYEQAFLEADRAGRLAMDLWSENVQHFGLSPFTCNVLFP